MDLRTAFRESRLVIALQEAFIALAPFVILASLLTLASQLPLYFGLPLQYTKGSGLLSTLSFLAMGLRLFVSIAIVLSLAYHFALRYEVDRVQAMLLALASFLSFRALLPIASRQASPVLSLPPNIDLWQIIIPIISVFLLKGLLPRLSLPLDAQHCFTYPCRVLQHIYAFLVSYAVLLAGWWLWQRGSGVVLGRIHHLTAQVPASVLLGLRTVFSQGFWLLGVHGNRLANSLLGGSVLHVEQIFPNLAYEQFYRLFAVAGGSGMGLSLLLALYLGARDAHSRKIARLSTPLVLFNINTLIIYCLPVVLNRFLIGPFLLLPLLNLVIAYVALSLTSISFHMAAIHWATPPFVDAWIVGGGDPRLLLLQAFLVLLDTLLYLPFVRRFSYTRSATYHQEHLTRNLELPPSLRVQQRLRLHRMQQEIIEANLRLEHIIERLTQRTLFVYYQPQVGVREQRCVGFEALLRIKGIDGRLQGPFFLQDIENAGLAPIIDLWVAHQVQTHLRIWEARGYRPPRISINLHPDTLNNPEVIAKIIRLLQGQPIEVEIIERAFLQGEHTERNLGALKRHGFQIAIDDFGRGYSSYRFLAQAEVDTVKTDISLVSLLHETKGRYVWEHMIGLCHRLGLHIVAEGVETASQALLLSRMGVDALQGFYFSEAIPMDEVTSYRPRPVPTEG